MKTPVINETSIMNNPFRFPSSASTSPQEPVSSSVEEMIRSQISSKTEEPFYVLDIQDILLKHQKWISNMPRVKPFYAVKCNPSPIILELLAALGCGFDCASKAEIDSVLSIGMSPEKIIYANPCKTRNFIKHASSVGVDMMTFDNEPELLKVAASHPTAKMILRIKVDDSHSVCKFSAKFGADVDSAEHLLMAAKKLNIDVIGVSFHVGSGCESADSYRLAIGNAKYVFEMAKRMGFDMHILDLGGGWPGTSNPAVSFESISRVVRDSLNYFFPEVEESGLKSKVQIIAEPGRFYVASAFTLTTMIIAKREIMSHDDNNRSNDDGIMYYINDGVYGSFNCIIFDHWIVEPTPLLNMNHDRRILKTTIWGPTCDSMDLVKKDVMMSEMDVGEWMMFKEMGAYTMAAASNFNGFQTPVIKYFLDSNVREVLKQNDRWTRIEAIVDPCDLGFPSNDNMNQLEDDGHSDNESVGSGHSDVSELDEVHYLDEMDQCMIACH